MNKSIGVKAFHVEQLPPIAGHHQPLVDAAVSRHLQKKA